MDYKWISTNSSDLFMILLTGLGVFIVLLVLTRMAGLRSFSKLSSFDFSITVAFGSILASTLLAESPSLFAGAFGLAVLFFIQYFVSTLRRKSGFFRKIFDNEPVLLMAGEKVIAENLTSVRMTKDDLNYKLRAAGITNRKQISAVILETTGDVSVLTKSDDFDISILDGVRDVDNYKDDLTN